MGGGDLNMKKSWHPLLLKNQERVWLEEKKALEEKKKLDQLRKEKEEERQLQELQRLQEEQTGKKRADKLEWMYATPASGSNQNPNDLEDYLLGKKRVDKILIGNENEKIGAAHKNFIAVQNANNVRDIAAKIREDPLFAIKQQEAAALEALKSNPLRLRELQERNGIKPSKKDKKEKKREKKEKKEQRRREREDRGRSLSPRSDDDLPDRDRDYHHHHSSRGYDRRSRSRSPARAGSSHDRSRDRSYHDNRSSRRDRSPEPRSYRRDRSPDYSDRRAPGHSDSRQGRPPWPRSDESSSRSPPERDARDRSRERASGSRRYDDEPRKRDRSVSPMGYDRFNGKRARVSPPPPRTMPPPTSQSKSSTSNPSNASDNRAARLAAMASNASGMSSERKERLSELLEKEKEELEKEERLRAKSKGMGEFLSHEQKKVFGGQGGLEERLRRGRAGLVSEST